MSYLCVGDPNLARALGTQPIKILESAFLTALKEWKETDRQTKAHSLGFTFYLVPEKNFLRLIAAPSEWPQIVVLRYYQMGELPHGAEILAASGEVKPKPENSLGSSAESLIRRYLNS